MSHDSFDRSETSEGSSNRTLGMIFSVVFLIIGLYPLVSGHSLRLWSLCLSAAFLLVAIALPDTLGPLNKVWTRFGLILHKVTSPIVLGIMFFLVFTPVGFLMRLLGKDPLNLRLNRDASTYWIERVPPGPKPDSLPNQF